MSQIKSTLCHDEITNIFQIQARLVEWSILKVDEHENEANFFFRVTLSSSLTCT